MSAPSLRERAEGVDLPKGPKGEFIGWSPAFIDGFQAARFQAAAIAADGDATIASLRDEVAEAKADYMLACRLVAAMHAAATGRPGEGPARGVVEDVTDAIAALQKDLTDTEGDVFRLLADVVNRDARIAELEAGIREAQPFCVTLGADILERALTGKPDAKARPAPVGADTGALVAAAEKHAESYAGDSRECITADVLNAFYAGAKWSARQQTGAKT